jgi:hypothetical protein
MGLITDTEHTISHHHLPKSPPITGIPVEESEGGVTGATGAFGALPDSSALSILNKN